MNITISKQDLYSIACSIPYCVDPEHFRECTVECFKSITERMDTIELFDHMKHYNPPMFNRDDEYPLHLIHTFVHFYLNKYSVEFQEEYYKKSYQWMEDMEKDVKENRRSEKDFITFCNVCKRVYQNIGYVILCINEKKENHYEEEDSNLQNYDMIDRMVDGIHITHVDRSNSPFSLRSDATSEATSDLRSDDMNDAELERELNLLWD